jgi:hypothetical protein
MVLSILVLTVPTRLEGIDKFGRPNGKPGFLQNCITHLYSQAEEIDPEHEKIQIIYLGDNFTYKVGEKRNILREIAKGKYIAFVDDDDVVSGDYVESLYNAIVSTNGQPDVINFHVTYNPNPKERKLVKYDAKYKKDQTTSTHFERLPNHLMCFKRSIAMKAPFEEINRGEDTNWAKQIHRYIDSQAFIEKVLYTYNFSWVTTEAQKR